MTRWLLLVVVLIPTVARAETKKVEARLVEGKFGKALDADATPLAFAGDERYRTPPLTVECWAMFKDTRTFNVLVSSDPKNSSRHWEVYTYSGTGHFAIYLPGYEPSEIVSKKNVCDGKWHYLAATHDGKVVKLYVDGQRVHEQAIKPRAGLKPVDGPLSIGQAIDGDARIGCNGIIDDVRISRVIRDVSKVPGAAMKVDADTVALWQFDGADRVLADPAWTPPPNTSGEPWERATDADWVDARLRQMDTGPTLNATLAYDHNGKRVLVYKGTAIRIGDKGEGAVIFDRNQLRFAAGWTGGYLNHSDRRFGLLNTPTPAGKVFVTSPSVPGWRNPRGSGGTEPEPTAPLPHSWGRYTGMHLHGKRVVLSYTIGGVEVRESPWLEQVGGQTIFTRTIEVGPGAAGFSVLVGHLPGRRVVTLAPDFTTAVARQDGVVSVAHIATTFTAGSRFSARNASQPYYFILPQSEKSQRFEIVSWAGSEKEFETLQPLLAKRRNVQPPLDAWLKAGPARYPKPLVTKGEVAKDTAPYVVDTLTIPYDNPHKALFFCTGLDFLSDGRIALCTCHGDVWLVKHDDKLQKVEWRRFATGLYQPLGLKVVDGKIVVLERGQLTRLHDLNGDGEADRYENLCHDWHTGSGEHSYDTCLETDSEGNFYFFKTGDTDLPHGGCLLRVSKDGKKVEVFATGFRHPIGLSVSPEGIVTGGDQEGNWMPMTRVDVYKKGGFYGDMRAHHRDKAPKTYDGPLVWLPKEVDNSAGGQVWVPHDRFGWPKGQLLHFSYGRCKLYALLTQKVEDDWQAGAVDLGVKFLSGSARGRFHPKDGHLYVCGLNGWQTAAQRDGCLQRVRYTGQTLSGPTSLSFSREGIRLGFARKLDAKKAVEKGRYRIEQWGYRWSANYGSARYSVKNPDRVGVDALDVESVTLSEDGKSVLIKVKELGPTMQIRIGYDVVDGEGKALKGQVYGTIHRLAGR